MTTDIYATTAFSAGRILENTYTQDQFENLLMNNRLCGRIKGAMLSKRGRYMEITFKDVGAVAEFCGNGLEDTYYNMTIPFRPTAFLKELEVKLNNVPINMDEGGIRKWLKSEGLKVNSLVWESMTVLNNILTGRIICKCEKEDNFTALPTYVRLDHGRFVGVWHRGQKRTQDNVTIIDKTVRKGAAWQGPSNEAEATNQREKEEAAKSMTLMIRDFAGSRG